MRISNDEAKVIAENLKAVREAFERTDEAYRLQWAFLMQGAEGIWEADDSSSELIPLSKH